MSVQSSASLIEREQQSLFQVYRRLPIAVQHASKCRIIDVEGNEYLDFLSGIAVSALGYGHPRLVDAITRQAQAFMHLSNVFYQEPQIEMAELLLQRTGYSRVFFSNSGTEAMEGALKLARKWGTLNNKTEIFAFTGGFHGRSYGALSVMDKPLYKSGMGPFLPNTHILPFNNSIALRNAVNESTCAVVLEFLQGEGGIVFAEPDFVNTMLELQEKYDFLIIADEVQAGAGRTGKFFGFDHFMVKPDIVTMAKGIGGGLPLGAILGTKRVEAVWEKGNHGTTFGGNPVACAAGIVVMKELAGGVQQNAHDVGCYLRENLSVLQQNFPDIVQEVRGCGLMAGLKLSTSATPLVEALLKRRVIANATAETVIRLLPPLIATRKDVDEFTAAMQDCLKAHRG
ncbi:MAG: aminotransferase class III-fold pyridoxal phosphate-dependent enzyme [Candidatus Kapaibacterium sp.]|nr:MAG: aminotransferase class III-fold pyridoxal phosphate-dependent enzyme [Candidatus Kapabacteria bacterium]